MPPNLARYYRHCGTTLRALTNDLCTAELLDAAFAPVRSRTCLAPDLQAEIAREDDVLHVRYGNARSAYSIRQYGDFGAAFCAVRELFARFCTDVAQGGAMYAGYFALAGRGFALLGESMVGKTTLLLHLASRGATFLGDETLTLAGDGLAQAFARLPSLREPGLALLPSAGMRSAVLSSPHFRQLPGGRLWYALEPPHLLGLAPSAQRYPLHAVIVLERGNGTPEIEALAPDETFRACAQRLYRKPGTMTELALLRRRLGQHAGYRVRAGHPADTADALIEVLARCA